MKIIAESSTTKTEWCLVEGTKVVEKAVTDGLNPFFLSRREISHSIRLDLPRAFFKRRWEHVYFYGAGCSNDDKKKVIESSLVAQFKTPTTVESDLLGAARGLLINEPGLACILGTGSNSCLYDGNNIVKNVSSLGFILGDEGSGAALGRLFVSDCLKNLAPRELSDKFFEKFDLDTNIVMDQVYNNPGANRTLSSYSFFLGEHLEHDYVRSLVRNEFDRFFKRNILQYDYKAYPLCFVGLVACTYSDILCELADEYGVEIKKIIQRSLPGIVKYHGGKGD
ncbi:MAG: hypothetical protein ACI308_05150 [Muribaculaceae bacterium]